MKIYNSIIFGLFYFLTPLCLTSQDTYWITNINDSGPGSLRQAIIDANSHVSSILDTIKFNIPGNQTHIISPSYNLPVISDPIYIDGLSQGAVSTNSWPVTLKVVLSGAQAGTAGEGLIITAGNSMIRGLVINEFDVNGIRMVSKGGNSVQTCFIGTDSAGLIDLGNGHNGIFIGSGSSNNLIGGNSYQFRNIISGNDISAIRLDGETTRDNQIAGSYIGTDVTGIAPLGNGGKPGISQDLYRAIYLNNKASYNIVGGNTPFHRNIISGNLGHGIYINSGSSNNIQNNFIGTDASDGASLGNTGSGIVIYAGQYNTIGGNPNLNLGNVIAANDIGIEVISYSLPAKYNHISGNIIGLSPGGTPMGNGDGIALSLNVQNNTLHWNTIASNLDAGIVFSGSGATDNSVIGNSIYSNVGLRIDLNNDGVSLNDIGDNDSGANQTQNFPILSNAFINNNGLIELSGSIPSKALESYQLYFFANSTCNSLDPNLNYGEGQQPLNDDIIVQTDANGEANFVIELDGRAAPGRHLASLAIDNSGNTSEFSPCVSIPNWPSLSFGVNGEVFAVAVDSNGWIYVGGGFNIAGNVPASNIARWDGISWSEVGGGTDSTVYALHFDPQGDLLIGGDFTQVGDTLTANRIAKWDGQHWTSFGSGMNDRVSVIKTSASGTTYAGGTFTAADGNNQIQGIARWNLTQWVALGSGTQNIRSIVVTPSSEVYAGGNFTMPGLNNYFTIAKWNGNSWTGLYNSSAAGVNALALKTNGRLYAADGNFLLEYNGSTWQTLLTGQGHASIKALSLDDDENLILGGEFSFADSQGRTVDNLALWDGSSFHTVGGGVKYHGVNALATDGDSLYVGGLFVRANGVPAENIARFWLEYVLPSATSPRVQASLQEAVSDGTVDHVQVSPNPFSSLVNLTYRLEEKADVEINIYDQHGRLVYFFPKVQQQPGTHSLEWDGVSNNGRQVPNGVYFCTISANNYISNYKFLKVKKL